MKKLKIKNVRIGIDHYEIGEVIIRVPKRHFSYYILN